MTCADCQAAQANPHHATFAGSCDDCAARMLAHSHEAREARSLGQVTPSYRRALGNAFGSAWREGHERVRQWAQRLK